MPAVAVPAPDAAGISAPSALTGPELVEGLRTAWAQGALSITGAPQLGDWLSGRIDDLTAADRLDRDGLSAVVDEVITALGRAGRDDLAAALSRRLLRDAYEFLLAVDACSDAAAATAPSAATGAAPMAAPAAAAPAAPMEPTALAAGPEVAREVADLLAAGSLRAALTVVDGAGGAVPAPVLVELAVDVADAALAAGAAVDAREACLFALRLDDASAEALWRLAGLAVDDRDPDLAGSYLGRLAGVLAERGDAAGAVAVSRKREALRRWHPAGAGVDDAGDAPS